ncbi:competence protein CoiA [Ferrimonas sediminicola]|uniref:Competence protein CoiA n=1 Tax=Ferrimonas sediminicola TaxID=2569538 RepID=A0A4U1B7I0_9GAMM|nr:competence protein CoiA family protein [Ferrimonas sediminicola]TKB46487.1 competence protein CoiA [Ferrimonas sediminicola]
MLCGIRASDNYKVLASSSEKVHGPYLCPKCRQEVVLKKGKIKIHHFAHKPPVTCSHGQGETEAHRNCKIGIYNALITKPNVTALELEKDFGPVVADVYCLINNVPVAIEVQRSNLSVNNITQRTEEYAKLGINVLWVGLYNEAVQKQIEDRRCSPKAWEKWCHAAYFGRVYYWYQGDLVLPIHFAAHKLYVEETEWYDSSGNHQSAGGYERFSKRYKTPVTTSLLSIAHAFQPRVKQAWHQGTVSIPNCRLYVDRLSKWW